MPVCHDRLEAYLPGAYSFADAELAENGVENLFDVDRAEHFAKGMQRVLKIDSDIFRRQTVARRGSGAIARLQGAP